MKKIFLSLLILMSANLLMAQSSDTIFIKAPGGTGGVTSYDDLTDKPTIPTLVSALTNDAGYITTIPPQSWSSITSKPTIPTAISQLTNDAGYITSVPAQSFSSITSKPTTLSGYGITDALGASSNAVSATKLATARTLSLTGDVTYTSPTFDGTSNVTAAATVTKINNTLLSGLNTGLLKNTTGTGIPVIATRGTDYLSPIDSLGANMISGTIAAKHIPVTNLYAEKGVKADTTTHTGAITFRIDSLYLDSIVRTFTIANTGVPKINSTDTLATLGQVRTMVGSGGSGGGGSGVPDLLDRVYANDSLALIAGLELGDLYQTTDGTVHVINRSEFSYTIDNTDGSANTYHIRLAPTTGNVKGHIYWGDGSDTVLAGNIYYELTHTYTSGSSYTVKIVTDRSSNLNDLNINNVNSVIKITAINNLKSLKYLTTLSMRKCTLYTIDTLTFPKQLTNLSVSSNNLVSFNLANPPTAITTLAITGNKIQPDDIVLNSAITTLTIAAMSQPGGATWTATDVNHMLINLDAMTFNSGAKTLDLTQFNSATPTGAGLTAKASLESKGWTITTD